MVAVLIARSLALLSRSVPSRCRLVRLSVSSIARRLRKNAPTHAVAEVVQVVAAEAEVVVAERLKLDVALDYFYQKPLPAHLQVRLVLLLHGQRRFRSFTIHLVCIGYGILVQRAVMDQRIWNYSAMPEIGNFTAVLIVLQYPQQHRHRHRVIRS